MSSEVETQLLLNKMWHEMETKRLEREEREAKSDPLAHKDTTVFAKGRMQYLFFEVTSSRGVTRYCWSKHTNVAGFYLGWRESIHKRSMKRADFVSRRVRNKVKAIALYRYKAHLKALEKAKPAAGSPGPAALAELFARK